MNRTVQWQGDNKAQVDDFLKIFEAKSEEHAGALHILALSKQGLTNIRLSLGDSLIFQNGRVGVTRLHKGIDNPYVEWTGENSQAVSDFLKPWKVEMQVIGHDLWLGGGGEAQYVVIKRGDRLVSRGSKLVVSVAGQDHRI